MKGVKSVWSVIVVIIIVAALLLRVGRIVKAFSGKKDRPYNENPDGYDPMRNMQRQMNEMSQMHRYSDTIKNVSRVVCNNSAFADGITLKKGQYNYWCQMVEYSHLSNTYYVLMRVNNPTNDSKISGIGYCLLAPADYDTLKNSLLEKKVKKIILTGNEYGSFTGDNRLEHGYGMQLTNSVTDKLRILSFRSSEAEVKAHTWKYVFTLTTKNQKPTVRFAWVPPGEKQDSYFNCHYYDVPLEDFKAMMQW